MVQLPWGECHPKEAPQPLPTQYQLPRPAFLLQLHSFLCVPGLNGLYWEAGSLHQPIPRAAYYFSFVLPSSLALHREKTPRENSLFSCHSAFSTFIPSSLFLNKVQQKSSPFCLLWDFEIELQGRVIPFPLPLSFSPRGTGAAGVTREFEDQRLQPRLFKMLYQLRDRTPHPGFPEPPL